MARSARFEMRLPPELLDRIDGARGDVLRTSWVETAIKMRLAGWADGGAKVAPAPDLEDDPTPRPRVRTPRGKPPVAVADPAQEELPVEPVPEEPVYPRRPPSRMTGGRRQ